VNRVTSVLSLCLILLVCCQKGEEKIPVTDISRFYNSFDTLAYVNLIKSGHNNVRYQLEKKRKCYLDLCVRDDTSNLQISRDELDWLTSLYTETSEVSDLRRKYTITSNWTRSQIRTKLYLDSVYQKLDNKAKLSTDMVAEIWSLHDDYAAIDDSLRVASTIFKLANYYYQTAQTDSAKFHFNQCLQICLGMGDLSQAGDCNLHLARLYGVDEADYSIAEKHYHQAMESFSRVGRNDRIALCQLGQGYIQLLLHQNDMAIRMLSAALVRFGNESNLNDRGYCCYYLGEAYCDKDILDSALFYAQESSRLRQEIALSLEGQESNLAFSESSIGLILQRKGALRDAEKKYKLADDIFRLCEDTAGICTNQIRFASLRLEQENYHEAERMYRDALLMASGYENHLMSLYGLVVATYNLGYHEEAKSGAKQCVDLVESTRRKIFCPETKVGILSDKIGFYHILCKIYLDEYYLSDQLEMLDSAYHYLERSKGISLAEALSLGEARVISTEEEELLNRLSSLQKQVILRDCDLELVSEQLRLVEESLFSVRLAQGDLHRTSIGNSTDIPSLDRVRELVVDSHSILVEYLISEFGCYVFAVTEQKTWVEPIEIEYDSLCNLVAYYVSMISKRPSVADLDVDIETSGRRLYHLLLESILSNCPQRKRLVIVPEWPLQTLPMGTLVTQSGEFLVESYDLLYLPSARVLQMIKKRCRKNSVSKKVIAFGDPTPSGVDKHSIQQDELVTRSFNCLVTASKLGRLKFSAQEVDSISNIFGKANVTAYIGSEASEKTLKSIDLLSAKTLHFATHGTVNNYYPELSALLLSTVDDSENDGLLQPAEIMRLRLNAKLAFLSACETGVGKSYPGEGVLSLARPFLIAGCDAVVITSWKIDDRCTVDLVADFYRSYKLSGSLSDALSEAQRNLIKSERHLYHHPYFWAPFVLVGLSD